jgi:hypothetical protein
MPQPLTSTGLDMAAILSSIFLFWKERNQEFLVSERIYKEKKHMKTT